MPNILIVDDSISVRKALERILASQEMTVRLSQSAEEALELVAEEHPDLIIADVVMPGKSGFELCQELKSNPATAFIPVLVISGIVNEEVEDKADAVGAFGVIKKPFTPNDIFPKIERALEEAEERQDNAAIPMLSAIEPEPEPESVVNTLDEEPVLSEPAPVVETVIPEVSDRPQAELQKPEQMQLDVTQVELAEEGTPEPAIPQPSISEPEPEELKFAGLASIEEQAEPERIEPEQAEPVVDLETPPPVASYHETQASHQEELPIFSAGNTERYEGSNIFEQEADTSVLGGSEIEESSEAEAAFSAELTAPDIDGLEADVRTELAATPVIESAVQTEADSVNEETRASEIQFGNLSELEQALQPLLNNAQVEAVLLADNSGRVISHLGSRPDLDELLASYARTLGSIGSVLGSQLGKQDLQSMMLEYSEGGVLVANVSGQARLLLLLLDLSSLSMVRYLLRKQSPRLLEALMA